MGRFFWVCWRFIWCFICTVYCLLSTLNCLLLLVSFYTILTSYSLFHRLELFLVCPISWIVYLILLWISGVSIIVIFPIIPTTISDWSLWLKWTDRLLNFLNIRIFITAFNMNIISFWVTLNCIHVKCMLTWQWCHEILCVLTISIIDWNELL